MVKDVEVYYAVRKDVDVLHMDHGIHGTKRARVICWGNFMKHS